MGRQAKWVDRIKDGRFFVDSQVAEPEVHDWEVVASWLEGEELRVYVGTYGGVNGDERGQVTLATCTPEKPSQGSERYGKAVFVGPRDEAVEVARNYWEMMRGGPGL